LFSCSSMVPQDAKLLKSEEVVINYKLPKPVIINFSKQPQSTGSVGVFNVMTEGEIKDWLSAGGIY
jgi:hypothetical protein